MLPGDGLPSDQIETAPFLYPRNIPSGDTVSYEIGGIGLNDTSRGMLYQKWTAYFDNSTDGNVYIKPDNGPAILYRTLPGITEVSLTFDQNMNPFLAYVQVGQARFYWFDTSVGGYVTTDLEMDALTPRCSLDYKYPIPNNISDILLLYVLNGNLVYRMQRDRFGVVYLLENLSTRLIGYSLVTVGLNEIRRFQWQVKAAFILV